jgi:hypothetical protein
MAENGRFVWRELMTTDVEAAKSFYGEVFGWKCKASEMPNMTYYLFETATGKQVAGMMKVPMPGIPPHWLGYVSVDDVDAAAERAKAAGGKVFMEPTDIPKVGRFAVVADAQGAATAPFKSEHPEPGPQGMFGAGEFCWDSINTTDMNAAIAFYTKVYGWKSSSAGPSMTTFGVGDGMENQVASVGDAPPGVPSHWMTYVVVDELGAARERVKRSGGAVLMEAIPVPGIGTFAVVQDPQKATICLFEGEPKKP